MIEHLHGAFAPSEPKIEQEEEEEEEMGVVEGRRQRRGQVRCVNLFKKPSHDWLCVISILISELEPQIVEANHCINTVLLLYVFPIYRPWQKEIRKKKNLLNQLKKKKPLLELHTLEA